MRISDWSSDVCSSDLVALPLLDALGERLDAGIHRGGPVQREGQPVEHLAERGQVLLDVLDQRGVDPRHVRAADVDALVGELEAQIGRASCRERVCKYV